MSTTPGRFGPPVRAGLALLRRDTLLYLSYRLRSLGQLGAIFLSLSLFFYFSRLVSSKEFATPESYFAFVVVGLAIIEVITASLTTLPQTVRAELMTGTFERLAVSPLGPVGGIIGMLLFPVALALVTGAALIVFATVGFGMELEYKTVPLAIPAAILGAAAFVPFSLLFAALVLLVKQVSAGAAFLVTGLSLVSGAFFPRNLLPSWVRWMADVQPLSPAIELLRHLLIGADTDISPVSCVVRLVGFTVVLLPLSLLVLRSAVDLCRRRATLTEY